jgi:hypothetical protein
MNSRQSTSTDSGDIEGTRVAMLAGTRAGGGSAQRVPFWALLVGIDKYVAQVRLSGCVNDVENMQAFLTNRYHVPPAQIRVLKNEGATRQAILDQFQSFLIANPQIQKGDQILFQYCGHGSQMPSQLKDAEPDGLDETIVPYDSRTANVYDIPDKTLGALLNQLAEIKGSNITVIMDSCHSGSGTRGKTNIRPGVRLIPNDERIPPPDLDAGILGQAHHRTSTRGGTASGWLSRDMPYVLMAGCRESELSQEYFAADVDRAHSWHGAFSYFLLKALNTLPSDTPYKMVMERVAHKVAAVCPGQNPQCEGEKDRVNSPIFGGVPMRMDPFISVQEILDDGNTVRLNGGRIVGLLPGAKLALYGPDVRTTDDLARTQPLATATVTEAGAVTSLAEVEGDPKPVVPELARAVVTERPYRSIRKAVAILPSDGPEWQTALDELKEKIATDPQASLFLLALDDPARPADLVVRVTDGRVACYSNAGHQLTVPRALPGAGHTGSPVAGAVLSDLARIARWQTIRSLENDDLDSEIAGNVRVGIRRYVKGQNGARATAEDLPAEAKDREGGYTFLYDPQKEPRMPLVVDIYNETGRPIYPHVFIMNADYSIVRVYPNLGQQSAIKPMENNEPYPVGLHFDAERLKLGLDNGSDVADDVLKVIVSTKVADLEVLQQGKVRVPPHRNTRGNETQLEQLLGALSSGHDFKASRTGSVGGSWSDEDWTTIDVSLTTVRAVQSRQLVAEEREVDLGNEMMLEKPAGLEGLISVSSWGQAAYSEKSLGVSESITPPPGFQRYPDLFQPVAGAATASRSGGLNGLLLTLDVGDEARKLVTPASPLKLTLKNMRNEAGEELVPVAFDGEDYFIVGYKGESDNVVEIVGLPQPQANLGPAGGAQAGTRGVGRAIRLFFYRKLGRYMPNMGLHRATLVDGKVAYAGIQAADFQPGERVAVFVHGFGADSAWMVQGLASYLKRAGVVYGHYLTWNYESAATGIADSGKALAEALAGRCGFGPNDGIGLDLYAHGMGSLVSRYAVERAGAAEYVDRLAMAGPPNNGTTLASTGRTLLYLTTLLLNMVSLIPPLDLLNAGLENLYEEGQGITDLTVDSPLVRELNSLTDHARVPYLVLAGENLVDAQDGGRVARIAHKLLDKGLDTLFGEQNDAVVGLSSMIAIRNGTYPAVTLKKVSCDHFHYFEDAETLQHIVSWLATP